MVRYPPLILGFTQAHLCDIPFRNVSRDNCAIPHENKHERVCDTIATSIARYEKYRCWASKLGNRPNTVSESTVSNSVSFFALTEFWGESSVSSSQPTMCVPKRTHRVFSELTEFAPKLSEAQ